VTVNHRGWPFDRHATGTPFGARGSVRSSLGYEQYDARLRRLGSSSVVALTSVDGLRPVSVDLARLPCLGASRPVSCTDPCTNTGL